MALSTIARKHQCSRLYGIRGVDGNSSLYMVMVGLLMFNVYWVQFRMKFFKNH